MHSPQDCALALMQTLPSAGRQKTKVCSFFLHQHPLSSRPQVPTETLQDLEVSAVSHDFRTAHTHVQTSVDELLTRLEEGDPPEQVTHQSK